MQSRLSTDLPMQLIVNVVSDTLLSQLRKLNIKITITSIKDGSMHDTLHHRSLHHISIIEMSCNVI